MLKVIMEQRGIVDQSFREFELELTFILSAKFHEKELQS